MKTYLIIKDGEICSPRLNKNPRGFTEEKIEEMRKNNELSDDMKLLCIEEEIEKYHLIDSKDDKCTFDEPVKSYMIWWNAYIDNNLNGFTVPIKVENNQEYREKLEKIFKQYIAYLNRPAFVYKEGLLDYIEEEMNEIITTLDYLINDNKDAADATLSKMLDLFSSDPFIINNLDKLYSFRAIAPFEDLHSEGYDKKYKKMMDTDLTFFRVRTKNKNDEETKICDIKDILHLPYNLKHKASSMRFSAKELPGLYLSTTTYTCSQECNWNKDDENLYASVFIPNEKGKTLKILNLTTSQALINGIFDRGCDDDDRREALQISMLKIFPLVIATSFSVSTEESIKYQYLIPQALMRVASKKGIDGIAYFSMKGNDEFEFPQGVNLAIPATDISDSNLYSEKCKGFEISKPIPYLENCKEECQSDKSYINTIYTKYNDCGLELFTAKVEMDGEMRFYGDTDYGKFDDYLTAQLKCSHKK